jgi:serine/threonine protein kinase
MPLNDILFDRFRLISSLGKGSYGQVFKAIDSLNNNLVAVKLETEKGSSCNQLKTEAKIYKKMQGTPISKNCPWPRLHCFGNNDKGDQIMVIDLLGPNIEKLLEKTKNGTFSPTTVAYFAEKMINLLEKFHMAGFVHRDLKTHNWVIEYCEQTYPKYPEVFLIDYGLAKTYSATPSPKKKSLQGTVRYSSIHTHLGVEQSRRDDMQSLGFILVYLLRNREKSEAYHHIMILKMSIPVDKLVENIHHSIKDSILAYMLYANSLMYHEKPNYEYVKNLFKNLATSFKGNIFT